MKNAMRILLLLTFVPMVVVSQTNASYDDYKKKQQASFEKYKSEQQAAYDAYRKKINEAYADYMSRSWDSFKSQKAVAPVVEPKVEPIDFDPKPQPQPNPQPIPIKDDITVVPAPTPAPQPIAPVVVEDDQPFVTTKVDFFGTPVIAKFPKNDEFKLKSLSNKDLSESWKQLSDKKYDVLVSSVLDVRTDLNLCDWAYLNMLKQVAQKQYGVSNDAVFMQSYLMTQSGYSVRMAKSNESGKLYLLVASQYDIFDIRYFLIGNIKYYALDCHEPSLEICEAGYEKEKPLSLQIASDQKLGKNMSPKRTLTSRRGLTAAVSVNKNNIDFYNTYPSSCINGDFTTKWAAYANTPLEKDVREVLYPQLRKSVQGMNERDAVNLILNWVQTAFVYGYDDEIWGNDRAFFGDETLFYPYCDCEDRSILFSRLVRDIMHLDVVLLYYPGHLATAVHFNGNVEGDYLVCRNRKYVVCDPTYIGAPVGLTMPKMNNEEAKIIILEK